MLQSLSNLRVALITCGGTSSQPQQQFQAQLDTSIHLLKGASVEFCRQCIECDVDSELLDLILADGTLPAAPLTLLTRILAPTSLPGQQPSPQLTSTEAGAATCTLLVTLSYLELLAMEDQETLPQGRELSLKHEEGVATAVPQLCAALAACLQLYDPPAEPSTNRTAQLEPLERVRWAAAQVLPALLHLASLSHLFSDTLLPQLQATALIALSCSPTALLQNSAGCATSLASTFVNCRKAALSFCKGAACAATCVVHAPTAVFEALASEPAFARMLLLAAVESQQRPATDSTRSSAVILLSALHHWLLTPPHHAALPAPTAPAISAQELTALALAMRSSRGPSHTESMVLCCLHQSLSHSKQHRAFPALARHAERALDRALALVAAAAETPGLMDELDFDRIALSTTAGTCTTVLATLTSPTARLCAGSGMQVASTWGDLRSRARWIATRGLVGKSEALRRACGRTPSAQLRDGPGTDDLQSAVDVAVLLLADGRSGAAALATCQSMLATQRKLLTHLAAGGTKAAAATAAAIPAIGAAASEEYDIGAGALRVGGAVDQPGTNPAGSPAGALDVSRMGVLAPCMAACSFLFPHVPLSVALHANSPPARLLMTCGTMQLLPLLLRQAARRLHSHPVSSADAPLWAVLLQWLAQLHVWGYADVTAAAGAPMLLHRMLLTMRSDCAGALAVLEAAASVVGTADSRHSWLGPMSRLWLLEQLEARSSLLPPGLLPDRATLKVRGEALAAALAVRPQPLRDTDDDAVTATFATNRVGGVVALARPQLEAYVHNVRSGAVSLRLVSLDVCTLVALEAPSVCHGRVKAWLGCCYRGCANLSGASEAALGLKKCGGCLLARYCSEACQRKAWRTGHRAACQQWQQTHAQPPQVKAEGSS